MSPDVQESPISRAVVVVMEQVIGIDVLLESSVGEEELQLGRERVVGDGLGECIFRLSHALDKAQSDGGCLVGLKGKTVNCS
jgi:hypothetical protein